MFKFLIKNIFTIGLQKLIMSFFYSIKYYKYSLDIRYISYIKNCTFKEYISIYENILIDSEINSYTYIAKKTEIYNAKIGKFCSIGPNSIIGLSTHPLDNFISTSPIFYSTEKQLPVRVVDKQYFNDSIKETIIGNDVWIGANVLITGGITIGNGAVIAAGSIVTKNVEEYAIVGGIPAKIIKYRFDLEKRKFLKESQWWNKSNINYLKMNYKKFHNFENLKKWKNHEINNK